MTQKRKRPGRTVMRVLVLLGLGALLALGPGSRLEEVPQSVQRNIVFAAQAQQPQPLQEGVKDLGPNDTVLWHINDIRISNDKGLVINGLRWRNALILPRDREQFLVAPVISIPYLEVVVADPKDSKKELIYKLKLAKASLKKDSTREQAIIDPKCGDAKSDHRYGHKMWATYELAQKDAQVDFKLEVTQTYIYWPMPGKFLGRDVVRSCRIGANNASLPQPEFWVEVYYKYTGKPSLKKTRLFLRADFDVDGRSNNVAIAVKEPFDNIITDPQRLPVNVPVIAELIIRAFGIRGIWACPEGAPPASNFFGESPANIDQAGGIVCKSEEYAKQDYDNYHQGNPSSQLAGSRAPSLWIPLCTPGLPFVNTPCVHIHLKKPDSDNKDVHQWIYAIRYHHLGETDVNPKNLIGPPSNPDPNKPEQLDDIVFWYVAESSKPEDFFFSGQGAFFERKPVPFQWAGLTCWTFISNPAVSIASGLVEGC